MADAATVAGYARHRAMVADLKRVKIGDRQYSIVRRSTGLPVAEVVQTGERGRDPYPWETLTVLPGVVPSSESMSAAIERVATRLIEEEDA